MHAQRSAQPAERDGGGWLEGGFAKYCVQLSEEHMHESVGNSTHA